MMNAGREASSSGGHDGVAAAVGGICARLGAGDPSAGAASSKAEDEMPEADLRVRVQSSPADGLAGARSAVYPAAA